MTLCNLFVLLLAFQIFPTAESSMVKLVDGGYENLVIAIHPGLKEDIKIIEKIQDMVKEATNYLFNATKKRLFIRSAKILIPLTWPRKNYTKRQSESFDKADVIIATPYLKYGDDPYTLQYGGCGEPGRYIHFTPKFLLDDRLLSVYGPRGRVFVHEWAHLRWGVFDEYNYEKPYYISGDLKVEATRCSTDILGINIKNRDQCQGSSCRVKPCYFDPNTGLYEEGCVFVPVKEQLVNASIMYLQALPSVSEFCDASNHNIEAPTLQNRMCDSRSTWEVIMNSTDISNTVPMNHSNIPVPSFSLLQYRDRVVTLVLDVSGSMIGTRIQLLYQAAEVFLVQIIESGSRVGIVNFSTSASILSHLVQVISEVQREKLKSLLPKTANGGTNICAGILSGIEVNKELDGSSIGTEILLLSDGEDNFDTSLCFHEILESGVILHFIALGPSATSSLNNIIVNTGGLTFSASGKLDTNGLIDAFSGVSDGNGDISQQAIQLESIGKSLAVKQCLNGTVFIDSTVGNDTFFLVTWQSAVPMIILQDPKGTVYNDSQFISDTTSKSSRLQIPGTAESGAWLYSLCNTLTSPQVVGLVVNSMAVDVDIPPVTVSAHMNTNTNAYPNPMVVYASVSQGFLPVKGAKVTAIIESAAGVSDVLELLDNGAGADIAKNDGIYSKYFTAFKTNGRYSLKVRVEGTKSKTRLAIPASRALYLPGFLENGTVNMNPSQPVFNNDDLYVGAFSRTASGGSFEVSSVPPGTQPDIFKPQKITDLDAKIVGDEITLSWTATGDDLDQGNASSYDIRMSLNPLSLRYNFSDCTSINTSSLTPQPAGSSETFTFKPDNVVIANGTILYFAIVATDKVSQQSDPSNIAQAALLIPPPTTTTTTTSSTTITPHHDEKNEVTDSESEHSESEHSESEHSESEHSESEELNGGIIAAIVCGSVIIICIILCITLCVVKCILSRRN
ncbi:calcium-activated chloride channel regulator 1-like [Spea bombifrons]|uniref:calcium-activated chloride channel regulator 1-like n=1 Tax=Spea bombifrons TaxID=233779 RepID=UPI00234A17FF|nr:calcium-activated chloride channel regulator 1-like [Spea bombifrons]